jgi:head-tail adaptor
MRIGSQRNLITIQRRVQLGVSKANEPNFVWQDWRADISCEVDVRRGKEQFDVSSKQRYSEEVYRFRTRYDEVLGADAAMRVSHEGQLFDIKAILPDGQRHWDCIIECTLQDGKLQPAPLSMSIFTEIYEGKVGVVYSGITATAAGGTAPYTFSLKSGSVPGLTLSPSTGTLSGTPSTAGTFPIEIQVTDDASAVDVLPIFDLIVEAA